MLYIYSSATGTVAKRYGAHGRGENACTFIEQWRRPECAVFKTARERFASTVMGRLYI